MNRKHNPRKIIAGIVAVVGLIGMIGFAGSIYYTILQRAVYASASLASIS